MKPASVTLSFFLLETSGAVFEKKSHLKLSVKPTNSVKALKEVVVLRIRLQFHQVHVTMLQYYIWMKYTVRHKIIHTCTHK